MIHRFSVFLTEVFRRNGMGVQKRDEPFFENAVQNVGIRRRFEYFFRRTPEIVEAFGERSRSYALEFFSSAGSDFRYYGGEKISSYFVGKFPGGGYDPFGLAYF